MLKTPLFPEYSKVQKLLKVLDGKNAKNYQNMWSTIWSLTGTPQNPVDWKEPDEWINERLKGKEASLANEIWRETNKEVNPRHVRGPKFLIDNYDLLSIDSGKFQLTKKGKTFLKPNDPVTREIDFEEGCVFILYQVSISGKGRRGAYFEEWQDYLLKNSNYKTIGVINDSLSRRLKNLHKRGLILKDGNQYSVSELGTKYLGQFDNYKSFESLSEESSLSQTIEEFNKKQKQVLLDQLSVMDPFQFEHVIKELLIAMGYDDVQVTSPTNDKGVDVVGSIQKGISFVKDVIQVKRNTTSNVQRKILDALRGSLHRFDAFQGTIITTSDYTKGTKDAAFESGAAPITLINGDKLLDLMIEFNIGIKKKKTEFFTVDMEYFSVDENEIGED
ncbi:restriction endonuclease [uncultured Aquimarina sp.]|uniref:restriction endonuclease n=1 Tax=uncultured Aquimarina sp. TaxID=575652 RepID=UPI0026356756|nr:restriction endonuclease [uncultured Aquimarina sp.]